MLLEAQSLRVWGSGRWGDRAMGRWGDGGIGVFAGLLSLSVLNGIESV